MVAMTYNPGLEFASDIFSIIIFVTIAYIKILIRFSLALFLFLSSDFYIRGGKI